MKRLSVWLLACVLPVAAFAQEPVNTSIEQSYSFSLDEAKEYAVKHNTSVLKSDLALKQSEQSRWAAIANYLPQGSASVNYNNYLGANLELFGQVIPMESQSTATLQVAQPLLNLNILVGIQLSEIAQKMSKNAVEQTALAVKQNVSSIYYSILVSEHSRDIVKKNLDNVKTLAKATKTKVNVGIGTQTEADEMEVTVANLENTLRSIDMNIELAYNSMRLLLGLNADDKLGLKSNISQLTDRNNTMDLLVKPFDLENNLDMKTSNLSVEMSEKQLKSSKYAYVPTVNAVFQHNQKIKSSGFDMTLKNTFVLQASIPLFSSGKNNANVKKAKFALQSAQLDNELAKDQLLIQEKQLRYNLKNAQAGYDLQKKNIEVSQRVFDNITKKYEQGLSSSLELTMANNNLLTAQSNYVNSVMSLLNAQDALQKLLGTL